MLCTNTAPEEFMKVLIPVIISKGKTARFAAEILRLNAPG